MSSPQYFANARQFSIENFTVINTTTAVVPDPIVSTSSNGMGANLKSKITQLVGVGGAAGSKPQARASPASGTVNANCVRYRRGPNTSFEAVGQYHKGHPIRIVGRVQGQTVNGWSWWDKMDNGFYISDYYVDWIGGVPNVCS